MIEQDGSDLLLAREVAELFGVHRDTVTKWAYQGKIPTIRTLGGRLRFRASDIEARLNRTRAEAAGARWAV